VLRLRRGLQFVGGLEVRRNIIVVFTVVVNPVV
jgi:hypothetical protein